MTTRLEIKDGDLPAALDYADRRATEVFAVELEPGETYEIDAPIRPNWRGMAIYSRLGSFPGLGTRIVYTGDPDEAGIIVWQGGRNLTLQGIELVGPCDPLQIAKPSDLLNDGIWHVPGNPRFSGLAIDPESADGQLSSSLLSCHQVTVSHCPIGFGVSLSGDPRTLNAENLTFTQCMINRCRTGWAFGQHQTKGVDLLSCRGAYMRTIIDTISHGLGQGCPPRVIGGAFSLFRDFAAVDSAFGPFYVDKVQTENMMTLGLLDPNMSSANTIVKFRDSFLYFHTSPEVDEWIANDWHAKTNAAVLSFEGCVFGFENGARQPLKIWNGGSNRTITFRDCTMMQDMRSTLGEQHVLALQSDRLWFDHSTGRDLSAPTIGRLLDSH